MIVLHRRKRRPFTNADAIYDWVVCWHWFGIQVTVDKLTREKLYLDLLPAALLSRHQWIHIGVGFSWLMLKFSLYVPTTKLYEAVLWEKKEEKKANA